MDTIRDNKERDVSITGSNTQFYCDKKGKPIYYGGCKYLNPVVCDTFRRCGIKSIRERINEERNIDLAIGNENTTTQLGCNNDSCVCSRGNGTICIN